MCFILFFSLLFNLAHFSWFSIRFPCLFSHSPTHCIIFVLSRLSRSLPPIPASFTSFQHILSQTHSERAPENEWLDILPHPVFSPDGDSFLLLASIQETGTEHFTHIKHVTITQQRMSVISHGRYEVSIKHTQYTLLTIYTYILHKTSRLGLGLVLSVHWNLNTTTSSKTNKRCFLSVKKGFLFLEKVVAIDQMDERGGK